MSHQIDDEILAKRDRQSFDAGFRSGIGFAIDEGKEQLIAASPELLEACKETREACAACFRVIAFLGGSAVDLLDVELSRCGVKEGFGQRAQNAIAKAEGGAR